MNDYRRIKGNIFELTVNEIRMTTASYFCDKEQHTPKTVRKEIKASKTCLGSCIFYA